MFLSSPTHSSLSCPPASEPSDVPCFQAHKWTPLSFSPPVGESSFATCHVSELSNALLPLSPIQQVSPHFAMCHVSRLTNPFLPLPPLQKVSPHFQHATFPSSPTRSS